MRLKRAEAVDASTTEDLTSHIAHNSSTFVHLRMLSYIPHT
jgi:hypothetical protein